MPTGIVLLVAVIVGVVTAVAVMIAVTIPVVGSVAVMIPITVVATIPVMASVAIMTSVAIVASVAIVPVCMIAVAITSIASITTVAIAGMALITVPVTITVPPGRRIGPLRPRIPGAGAVCICPLNPFSPRGSAFVTVVSARIALIAVATVAIRPCIASAATPAFIPRFRSARGLRLGLIGGAVSAFAPLRPSLRAPFFAFTLAGLAAFFPRGDLNQIGVRAAVNNWS